MNHMLDLIARELSGDPGRGVQAKAALLQAGMEEFGRCGLEGARTRSIVERAGQNLGAITYHFGGKLGLYRAIAEVMTGMIGGRLKGVLERVDGALEEAEGGAGLERRRCGELVFELVEPIMEALVGDDRVGPLSLIIMREQIQPTPIFEIYYERVMRPLHERLTRLVSLVTGGDPEGEAGKVLAHTLMGQIIIFRNGREALKRRTGWERIGEAEKAAIYRGIRTSLEATIRGLPGSEERGGPTDA